MGENFKNNRMKSKELGNRIIGKIFSIMCVSPGNAQIMPGKAKANMRRGY